MAVTIKHAKTDTIADWTQADLDAQIALGNYPVGTVLADIVLPSDWNNDHTISGTVPIANGGTGETTANAAINALLPSQSTNANKVLTTDGTNTSWQTNGTGTVTSVTGTAPVSVATGTTTPVISMPAATGSVDGYLTSTDWTTFNSKGTGNVVGPASATDNAIARYDTTTGKLIQNSSLIIDDNGNLTGLRSETFSGATPASTPVGTMWFDSSTDTLNFQQNNITQQVGEELFIYGRATANITDGQIIALTGVYGTTGVVTFAPAPIGTTNADLILGMATEPIANNAFGRITAFGTVHGLDTAALGSGTTLYYDPTVVGGYTTTMPTAPNIKVQIGVVTKAAGGTNGSIAVGISHGESLNLLADVQVTTPTAAQLLTYNSASGYWKNTSLAAGTGISVGTATSGVVTVTNSLPDQTVSITGGGGAVVTGTYPNFTITTPSGTVTSVSAVAPVVSSGGPTPIISMAAANATTNGYLTSTDWSTFNGKQVAYTNLTTFGSLANATGWLYNNGTGTLSYSTPTASDVGAVPTTRTLTINGTAYDLSANRTWSVGTVTSVAALTLGTSGTDLSSTVATGTTTPVITLNVPTASATNRGALSAADWTTFNNKQPAGTYITSVTATSPVTSTGGTTPLIAMPAATSSVNGYLTSTDWTTFNSKGSGSVTTVSVASANGFAGTVANASTTPAITLTTSITGMLKGNGTAISAGTAGTDYVAPATATNFTAQQYFGNVALTDAATISWAASTQQVATFTFVSSNRTMGAPTGLVSGAFYALAVIQNSGSNTLTWNSVFKWTGGTAPTLSTAASAKDYFVFRSDGTNLYEQGRSLGVA